MTTRRLMIAVAVSALLSTGLVGLIGLFNQRWHYLKWAIGHFAFVKNRTGDIQKTAEATRLPGPPPTSRP